MQIIIVNYLIYSCKYNQNTNIPASKGNVLQSVASFALCKQSKSLLRFKIKCQTTIYYNKLKLKYNRNDYSRRFRL